MKPLNVVRNWSSYRLPWSEASYRQLAFVGDAALWLLFAEHAFHTYGHLEDPSR
eukprot:gene3917-4171_t